MKVEFLRGFWKDEGSIDFQGRLTGDSRSAKIIEQLILLHQALGFSVGKCMYMEEGKPMYKIYVRKTPESLLRFWTFKLFKHSIVTRGYYKGFKKIDVVVKHLKASDVIMLY